MQSEWRDIRRARSLAQQRGDIAKGRFSTERIYRFDDFGVVPSPGAVTRKVQCSGPLTPFVRLVAMRGGVSAVQEGLPLTGLELAHLFLQLTINGSENLVSGTTSTAAGLELQNAAEFDALFGPQNPQSPFVVTSLLPPTQSLAMAPWYWWAAPPRLRSQDVLAATVTNDFLNGEIPVGMTPFVELRIVDDRFWREMYGT